MLGLDITTNTDSIDSTSQSKIWGITALQLYSYSISFKTLVDSKWTGNEQRNSVWTEPRRVWTLEFQKDAKDGRKFEEFFKECKGRFRKFKFKWAKTFNGNDDLGGDDKWYTVRFNSDELKIEVDYMGFRHFVVELIEVR